MAYRPSQRGIRIPPASTDANITPMMNLMVVLIPLLLSTAEFVRLGIIEINLPPAAAESGAEGAAVPAMPKLDLAVTITDRGFFISSAMSVLSGERSGEPTLPLIRDEEDSLVYDYRGLSEKLLEIKKKVREAIQSDRLAGLADSSRIILTAEPSVVYQTVISTMDAARSIRINATDVSLFPDVSLSPGVY